jgi:drug/metabolite transporter (DMT)-like permease
MKLLHIGIALFIALLTGLLPVVHKHLLGKYNPMSILIISAVIYSIAVIGLAYNQFENIKTDLKKITWTDSGIIVLLVLLCTFFSNILYYIVLKANNSFEVASIIDAAPFFTLILAVMFLHEHIHATGLLGVIFTIVGVILISMNDHKFDEFVSR